LHLAIELARHCIARARAEADPRYLGHAEAALGQWSDLAQPPGAVLVVRATIRQSNHDFDRALADLDLALKLEPNNAQAWLTRASILQVQGRFAEAKRAFLPLLRLTSELVSTTCASSAASLSGAAEKSYELLSRVLARASSASREEQLWATTTLAEMAVRLGQKEHAEKHFRTALALDPNDVYLLGAFADFLLDQARSAEVIELLRNRTRIDALLLTGGWLAVAWAGEAAVLAWVGEATRERRFRLASVGYLLLALAFTLGHEAPFDDLFEAMDITNRQKCFWRKAGVLAADQMLAGPLACTLDSGNITVATKSHVVITNVQQLATTDDKWLKQFPDDFFDMIIVDEAHHSAAASWQKVIDRFPRAKVILLTATPFRSDRQELDGTLVFRYPFRNATLKGYIKRLKASYVAPSSIELSFCDARGRSYSLDEVCALKVEDWFSRGVALARPCNHAHFA
jgi:tetratricopeptide (TPR) repeat protein